MAPLDFWLHENPRISLWIKTLTFVPRHWMQFLSDASSEQG